jgi:hypothetical protein
MTSPVSHSGGNGQAPDTRMIILIRHAEKPLHPSGSPHGVDPEGREDPHSLTVTGWIRAGALVELFAPSRGEPPADLRRPDTIYGSAHAGGHSKRSVQTVTPLAARLGLEVIKRYAAGDEAHLTREISRRPGTTLVAWHHEAIHKIAEHLGGATRPHLVTGHTTVSTSSGPSPQTATGGASAKYRNSCCPATCPTRSKR